MLFTMIILKKLSLIIYFTCSYLFRLSRFYASFLDDSLISEYGLSGKKSLGVDNKLSEVTPGGPNNVKYCARRLLIQ